jgi:hypothetical protein
VRLALVLGLLLAAGCARSAASRPTAAVDAYVAALEAGDWSRAYDLLSARYRREHTREEFVRMMRESQAEARETAARLRAGARRVEVEARLDYGDPREELLLVEEGGAWRIAGDPLLFYPQDTPSRALRSFLRAVHLQRWDVALRFVPSDYRAHMTEADVAAEFEGERREENEAILRLLTANADNVIEVQGDLARMPYGDRYEIRFKREDGIWKIEELY